ncbi:protein NEDD1-like [Zingiber officinale]|uniref:protein NEDD1-like n=1 Tax=Zingiber officinale TaxID=94328 RepID=UPI001C4D29E2|nr:protein NEDD1-like [Zingiber officinale]
MQFVDSSVSLLATCGGDTVKLFDVTVDAGDPCTLSYTPSPGSQINSVKWNHTNLVVASAGDDKKISLWNKNGQSMGSFPSHGSDLADDIEVAHCLLINLFYCDQYILSTTVNDYSRVTCVSLVYISDSIQ